jgi:hypothetical protein
MDTEYRTMHNLFDGAVYEDFDFYCTRKLPLRGNHLRALTALCILMHQNERYLNH